MNPRAQFREHLSVEEVLAALGESTAKVVDAQSSEVAMEVGAGYVVRREGDSRSVITLVSEFVAHGPALAEAYAVEKLG